MSKDSPAKPQSQLGAAIVYPLLFIAILTFAQMITIIGTKHLDVSLQGQAVHKQIMAIMQAVPEGVEIFSFVLPTLIALLYALPVILSLARPALSSRRARINTLSAPLVFAILGFSGWMITLAGFFHTLLVRPDLSITFRVGLTISLNMILAGSFTFVITYYLLAHINRQWFIPRIFPEGVLTPYRGIFHLSLRQRFFIYLYAVHLVPSILYTSALLTHSPDLSGIIIPAFLILLAITVFLTMLVAHTFRAPLTLMKGAADSILAGSYKVAVPVRSADELGRLGEGLNAMAEGLHEKEMIKDTFGKMVDPRIRDHLLEGDLALGGSMKEAVILFSDIRSFTSIAEALPPQAVVNWLNRYFDRMSRCIEKEGGLVSRFIGDAVMALFGVPLPMESAETAAVRAAAAMQRERIQLNRELAAEGLPEIRAGIGIHRGPVLAGNIGSASRMEYTVIGDAVNLASRIEGACKTAGSSLLLSRDTAERVSPSIPLRPLTRLQVKGREEPVDLYTLASEEFPQD